VHGRPRAAGAAARSAVPLQRQFYYTRANAHAQLALKAIPQEEGYAEFPAPAGDGGGARREEPLEELKYHGAAQPAPRAGARRERRPAREPCSISCAQAT
jgi:hypothetical protein